MSSKLDRKRVAETWLLRGLSDLLFAFDCDNPEFEYNARFSEIMGLEKFLKAVLLYQHHTEYEKLSKDEARQKLNKMAMGYGHKFNKMLKELTDAGLHNIAQIRQNDYDGYNGDQLVQAVEKGYMETRYPVPTMVSDKFTISVEDTDFTHDPLSSSGITKFMYAICNTCFYELSQKVDFTDMLNQFREKFENTDSFSRFNDSFWEAKCKY